VFQLLYVIEHMLSVLLLSRRGRIIFVLLGSSMLSFIYLFKPDTYDIGAYTNAVSYPYYEPVFSLIMITLRHFMSNRMVVWTIQLLNLLLTTFLGALLIANYKEIEKADRAVALLLLYSSVGFVLGNFNGIRRFMAMLLIAISVMLFFMGMKGFGILMGALSFFVHSGSAFFALIILLFALLARYYFVAKNTKRVLSRGAWVVMLLIISFLIVFVLPELLSVSRYRVYLDKEYVEGRTSFNIKYFTVLFVAALSEYLAGRIRRQATLSSLIRLFRIYLIILMLPVVFFSQLNEIGAKILGFYFFVEMITLCIFYLEKKVKSAVVIMLAYGVAFNALNVIGGSIRFSF